ARRAALYDPRRPRRLRAPAPARRRAANAAALVAPFAARRGGAGLPRGAAAGVPRVETRLPRDRAVHRRPPPPRRRRRLLDVVRFDAVRLGDVHGRLALRAHVPLAVHDPPRRPDARAGADASFFARRVARLTWRARPKFSC